MNVANVLSIGFIYKNGYTTDTILELQKHFSEKYKYYEIVIVFNPSDYDENFVQSICDIPNTNVFCLNEDASVDVLRNNIFKQSIGDFILYIEDLRVPFAQLQEAAALGIENNIDSVRLKYTGRSWFEKARNTVLGKSFFWVSGLDVAISVSYTGCYSRALINAVLADATQNSFRIQLASLAYDSHELSVAEASPCRETARHLSRCIDIIGSVPHRLLYAASFLALCGVVGNVFYGLYVLAVWFFKTTVQPGWVTSSLLTVLQSSLLFFVIFLFSAVFAAHYRTQASKRYFISKTFSKNNFITSFSGINVENK